MDNKIDINRIIEMAWEEQEVIKIMRKNMKRSSFRMWRERVSGRKTKHRISSNSVTPRFKSYNQK